MLEQKFLVGFVVETLLAGMSTGCAHHFVECAGKEKTASFSPALGFHRTRFDEIWEPVFHFRSQLPAMSEGVEGKEVEGLEAGKRLFAEALDVTEEDRVLHCSGKREENLVGCGAGEIRERLGC